MAWHYVENTGIATRFRLILLALLTLLLLSSAAYAQANRPVVFQNLLDEQAHPQRFNLLPDRTEPTEHPPSALHKALRAELSASHWWQTNLRSTLPPASVFALQTNLRKYLDTWPPQGATVPPDEPSDEPLTDDDLM